MQDIGFTGAVTLGAVFAVSGAGKLRDPGGIIRAVMEYRVLPSKLAIVYGRALPPAELLCAGALVSGIWPIVTSAAAGALLLSFMIGVVVNLARGRALDCHCFGSRRAEPLGPVTVIRILVLLLCAGVSAFRGSGLFVPPPHGALPALFLAAAIVLMLYLVRAIPLQFSVWRTVAPETWREPHRGRMISLRSRSPWPEWHGHEGAEEGL